MRSRLLLTAVLADLVCVLVFAAVGRVSHGEGLGPLGVLGTTWPFAAGWLVGWALVVATPLRTAPPAGPLVGTTVWISTVVLGMVLRAGSGGGVQVSFVVVTFIVLGVFLLGWRGVVALVRRSRREVRADAQV